MRRCHGRGSGRRIQRRRKEFGGKRYESNDVGIRRRRRRSVPQTAPDSSFAFGLGAAPAAGGVSQSAPMHCGFSPVGPVRATGIIRVCESMFIGSGIIFH